MPPFLIVVSICAFIIFLVFALQLTGYLKVAAKSGAICFLILLIGSFLFGLFNDFSFIHGSTSAGLDSALAYMLLLGFWLGPVIFIVGALCGAVVAHIRKVKKR